MTETRGAAGLCGVHGRDRWLSFPACRPADLPDERRSSRTRPRASTARRVLVLAPHPDDEVFGCGGALADLAARGAAVDVLVLTDGAAAGAATSRGARRIAARRAAESRAALALLGGGDRPRGRAARPRPRRRGRRSWRPSSRAGSRRRRPTSSSPRRPSRRTPTTARSRTRSSPSRAGARGPRRGGARARDGRVLRGLAAVPAELPLRLHARPRPQERGRRAAFASQAAERDYAGFVERPERVPAHDAAAGRRRGRGLRGLPGGAPGRSGGRPERPPARGPAGASGAPGAPRGPLLGTPALKRGADL